MNQLELLGEKINVLVNSDLSVTVLRKDGQLLWESSKSHTPIVTVSTGNTQPRRLPLASAAHVSVSAFSDGKYRGYTIRLRGFKKVDVTMELFFAIDTIEDELLIQIAQVNGPDTVVSIEHLYRFEKPVADGGYIVLPHGSGYLIPADCPDELPGKAPDERLIGGRWSLPIFGMVHGKEALCVMVESWWDCEVGAEHIPGDISALDFNWSASLGNFSYPRRFFLRFDEGMDYVAMAKIYREYAKKQGLLQTLKEKVVRLPVIRQYIKNILLRWPAWNAEDGPSVLSDIRKLRRMDFGINFFFPKWSSAGYAPERNTAQSADALWQAYLHPDPVPGGWPILVNFADEVRNIGCLIQGMINMLPQNPSGIYYDEGNIPENSNGRLNNSPMVGGLVHISQYNALHRIRQVFDHIKSKGLKLDVLYYDGYSAHSSLPEDFSSLHPMTRRQIYEVENACFAETRRHGIMPGGELARFWCMADCDYFFYTDWSQDRLTNVPTQGASAPVGEPIPLFQLVFHDCFIAGFSGGGYKFYLSGYDWWTERTPRLYELLYGAAPCYNWLPEGSVPIKNWESPKLKSRLAWLKRWSRYYQTIAMSEMTSHQFLTPDYKRQRIEYANGVVVEFDMTQNRFRLIGLEGFSGDWELPEEL